MEQFRRDITHPALRERLAEGFAGFAPYVAPVQEQARDGEQAEATGETSEPVADGAPTAPLSVRTNGSRPAAPGARPPA